MRRRRGQRRRRFGCGAEAGAATGVTATAGGDAGAGETLGFSSVVAAPAIVLVATGSMYDALPRRRLERRGAPEGTLVGTVAPTCSARGAASAPCSSTFVTAFIGTAFFNSQHVRPR